MKKFLVVVGVALAFVVVAVMIIVGNVNSIVKKGVESTAPMILQAPVNLDKVDISLFSGSGKLDGLTIGNPKGYKTDYAFRMKQLKVDLVVKSVTSDLIHIKDVVIDSPDIMFEGGAGKSNLTQLQDNAKAFALAAGEKQKESSDSQGKKMQIDHLMIKNAKVNVSMNVLQGKELTIPLPTIELKDIGKDKGAGISDVVEVILVAVNKAVVPAVQTGISGMKVDVPGNVRQSVDKVKGLLNGK